MGEFSWQDHGADDVLNLPRGKHCRSLSRVPGPGLTPLEATRIAALRLHLDDRMVRRAADDRLTLRAHVILGPAGALVVSPIQFVFNSPQRNAAAKPTFEQLFAVYRYISSFAGNDSAVDMPVGGRQEQKKPAWRNTRRHSTTSAYSSTNPPAGPGCSLSSHPTTSNQSSCGTAFQSAAGPLHRIHYIRRNGESKGDWGLCFRLASKPGRSYFSGSWTKHYRLTNTGWEVMEDGSDSGNGSWHFSFGGLALKKHNRIVPAKIALAAGIGPLGFAMLRMVLGGVYDQNRVWYLFWEETARTRKG